MKYHKESLFSSSHWRLDPINPLVGVPGKLSTDQQNTELQLHTDANSGLQIFACSLDLVVTNLDKALFSSTLICRTHPCLVNRMTKESW